MATNPLPPGTKNLTVNTSEETVGRVKALAVKLGVSASQLCSLIISSAVETGDVIQIVEKRIAADRKLLTEKMQVLRETASEYRTKPAKS